MPSGTLTAAVLEEFHHRPLPCMPIYKYGHTACVFEMLRTLLIFSSTGGMEKEATTFYERLADMFSWKLKKPYWLSHDG